MFGTQKMWVISTMHDLFTRNFVWFNPEVRNLECKVLRGENRNKNFLLCIFDFHFSSLLSKKRRCPLEREKKCWSPQKQKMRKKSDIREARKLIFHWSLSAFLLLLLPCVAWPLKIVIWPQPVIGNIFSSLRKSWTEKEGKEAVIPTRNQVPKREEQALFASKLG